MGENIEVLCVTETGRKYESVRVPLLTWSWMLFKTPAKDSASFEAAATSTGAP
jgi:hypothetical protein